MTTTVSPAISIHNFHIKKASEQLFNYSDANICKGNLKGVPFPANFVSFAATVGFKGVIKRFFCCFYKSARAEFAESTESIVIRVLCVTVCYVCYVASLQCKRTNVAQASGF